jgi:hypothetical protein
MRDLDMVGLSPAEIDAILAEALRRELVRIIERQDTANARSDTEIHARVAALEAEVSALRRAARRNDFAPVDAWSREAATSVSVAIPEDMPAALGRKALHLKADITTVEARVEDGEDALRLAQPLVAPFSAAPVEQFVKRPVLLSEAFDRAIALQTKRSMLPGMRAARALFLEFLGDICQRRVNFPQKCRSKIPHLFGSGDQPGSVIGDSVSVFRWTPATLRGRGWSDRGVGPNMLGDEVGVAA